MLTEPLGSAEFQLKITALTITLTLSLTLTLTLESYCNSLSLLGAIVYELRELVTRLQWSTYEIRKDPGIRQTTAITTHDMPQAIIVYFKAKSPNASKKVYDNYC